MTNKDQYSNNPFKIPLSLQLPKPEKETEKEIISSPEPKKKEVEIPLIEWVRAGWEVPKLIRKGVNLIALEESMDKKDIAHALLDYALKHKDKINFRKYHKPKNN